MRKNGDKWRWCPSARQPVCVWKVLNVNFRADRRETGGRQRRNGAADRKGCQKFKALHVIFPAGCAVLRQLKWKRLKRYTGQNSGCQSAVGLPGQRVWPADCLYRYPRNNLIAENKKLFAERRDPVVKRFASTSTTSNNPHGEARPSLFRRHNTMKPSTEWWRYLARWRSSPLLLYFRFPQGWRVILALLCRFYWRDRWTDPRTRAGAVVAMVGISIIAILSPWLRLARSSSPS